MLRFRIYVISDSKHGNGILEDKAQKLRQGFLYAIFKSWPILNKFGSINIIIAEVRCTAQQTLDTGPWLRK